MASLAGIGSQLHVYDVIRGLELAAWRVFDDGTRVRGIHGSKTSEGALLLIHGARTAKVECGPPSSCTPSCAGLNLVQCSSQHGINCLSDSWNAFCKP